MLPIERCFSCGGNDLQPFYEQPNVPANDSLVFDSRAEAVSLPRGDLRLALCRRCGFIQNVLFETGRLEYAGRYEESQAVSLRFSQYQDELVCRLVNQYDLKGKSVLEIGAGNGDFLYALTRVTGSHAVAIDPWFDAQSVPDDLSGRIDAVRDFYSERQLNLTADFIACRHTLEHVQDVAEFVGTVRKAIGEQREPVVFFEVPDVLRALNELAFWDLYYEHCSYFSLGSLARLFRAQGFDIFNLRSGFDGQYLLIETVASNGGDGPVWDAEHDMAQLQRQAAYFRDHYKAKLAEWGKTVRRVRQEGGRAVLWGSGAKAVSFVDTLGLQDEVEFVVDLNPRRQGKYMAGGGQQVVAPGFLREYKPDLVVAMNNVYVDEIRRELDAMGLQAELTSV